MKTDKYVFFWGGTFSQWFPSKFEIDGVEYVTAEQYMMAMKAKTFGDTDAQRRIMETENPRMQKAIGREVKNFDPVKWSEVAQQFVYEANMAKFTENIEMYNELMSTGDREIVEASPEDRIWGIGLHASDPRCLDKSQWLGTNLLGIVLMRVREDIRNGRRVS